MAWRAVAALIACLVAGGAAWADSARLGVYLGGRALGSVEVGIDRPGASAAITIESRIDNTPLGVGDGSYSLGSKPARLASGRIVRQFLSRSIQHKETAAVSILTDGARVVEVAIAPPSDRTRLSDPARVPEGVADPAQAFAHLVFADACPGSLRIYDGRRVAQIVPRGEDRSADRLTCRLDYRVLDGPGHLAPFRIARVTLTAIYLISGDAVTGLQLLDARVGPFHLQFRG